MLARLMTTESVGSLLGAEVALAPADRSLRRGGDTRPGLSADVAMFGAAADSSGMLNGVLSLRQDRPFPSQASGLLQDSLAAARTGLSPAGDDELPVRS
jgi:hypothetical protein